MGDRLGIPGAVSFLVYFTNVLTFQIAQFWQQISLTAIPP
jgi:hypothetical protein